MSVRHIIRQTPSVYKWGSLELVAFLVNLQVFRLQRIVCFHKEGAPAQRS